jgi:hypothetical protein
MNNLNGEINLKQNNSIYQPTSKIDSLKWMILSFWVKWIWTSRRWKKSFQNFYLNSSIENENGSFVWSGRRSIEEYGNQELVGLNFDKFNLGVFENSLGTDVISNIHWICFRTIIGRRCELIYGQSMDDFYG